MRCVTSIALAMSIWLSPVAFSVEDVKFSALAQQYQPGMRTLLKKYCQECHSDERTEAEVDLASFETFADVRKHPRLAESGEMLDSGQMPPKDAPPAEPMPNANSSESGSAAI